MLAKVASSFGISGIQIVANHMTIALPLAVLRVALKDMDMTVFDIFD